jgi:diaminopimelate epimerase
LKNTALQNIPFAKYHGLGNEYIVIDGKFGDLSKEQVVRICNVHFGIGSDGILFDLSQNGKFQVKIINPDGSEAEKSGNGLRIFSRYLFDIGAVKLGEKFEIQTLGGLVKSTVIEKNLIKVEMGKVSFLAMNEKITVLDREFSFCEANVGNPHCVIVLDEISPEIAKKYGSEIEKNKRFVNRTNVQFVKIINKNAIKVEIWERGAGYTLASGSSSTAAAAVAHKLGFCGNEICVKMQGGELSLSYDENFNAEMTGAVQKICTGEIVVECFE